ncbi:hypothetical protein [Corynebacterium pseudotuberculosis]|uniref:hypothetical protein n=1 Tax=Corynebacterium pseudotuberculosis TaxID=1719 RepID=UPI00227AC1D0|nr:hypothetical protein [Corynebacterium pseudotuberculosis]WAF41984.1 hypothetical protein LJT85_08495 [Corynebacterium pseudotuberculosis]
MKSEADWTKFTSADAGMAVLNDLDEFLAVLDGPPTALLDNGHVLATFLRTRGGSPIEKSAKP